MYLLKGPIDTEGTIRLISTLKKSPFEFRMYDPAETPKVSFYRIGRMSTDPSGS